MNAINSRKSYIVLIAVMILVTISSLMMLIVIDSARNKKKTNDIILQQKIRYQLQSAKEYMIYRLEKKGCAPLQINYQIEDAYWITIDSKYASKILSNTRCKRFATLSGSNADRSALIDIMIDLNQTATHSDAVKQFERFLLSY